MDQDYFCYKLLVVGDQGVGKTSLCKRHTHNVFPLNYKPTIGVDFAIRGMNLDDNTSVRLQLWDIAGQERFGNMTRVYYKDAFAAFVVYDVTRRTTFEDVAKWKADLDKKVTFPDTDEPIPCVLLANKVDLDRSGVDESALNDYCKEYGFIKWFAVSALDGTNVAEAFEFLVRYVYTKTQNLAPALPDEENVIPIDDNQHAQEASRCAC